MAGKGSTTKGYIRALLELGATNPQVVVMDADVAESVRVDAFQSLYPERFVQCGVSEQNMMGIAAGLSLAGKVVFVNTFAAFATCKTFDQLRLAIAYPRANVKVVGGAAGLALGEAGPSHHAIEDLALTRVLPNMTVLSPCDEEEAYQMTKALAHMNGPAYMRLFRADVPALSPHGYVLQVGKAVVLRPGRDVSIFATGLMVARAMEAAEELAGKNIRARVVNVHTIKPPDVEAITQHARETGAVVTVEEHTVIGGLGSAVAEALGEHCPVPLKRLGIPDTFCESASTDEQLERYGMSVTEIVGAACSLKGRRPVGTTP